MGAAIEVQHLAEARPGLPAAAVAAAGAALGDELGRLQGLFDEGVGQGDPVVALRDLVEVADIEVVVRLPIQLQDPLDLGEGHLPGRGAPAAAIPQAVIALALVAQPPAAQGAGTPAEDLLGLPPRQLAAHRLQQHLLHFHRPLHDGRGVGHGDPPRSHFAPTSDRSRERSDHLLQPAVRSCAFYRRHGGTLLPFRP